MLQTTHAASGRAKIVCLEGSNPFASVGLCSSPGKINNQIYVIAEAETKTKHTARKGAETMEVIVANKDLSKEELYFLTKAQDVMKMTEAAEQTFDLDAWCIYLDKNNADGEEVELFSMRTTEGETYATNSPTFIKAFREILDIFEPDEVKRLKVMDGVSKNNRTFVTCAYVSPDSKEIVD